MALRSDPKVLVDALPYIDQGYDETARQAAMALIEEECKRYRPTKDYLAYLPAPKFDAFEDKGLSFFGVICAFNPKELGKLRHEIQEINFERKQKQQDAGAKLKALESSWVSLVSKNYQIEQACSDIEREMGPLRKKFKKVEDTSEEEIQ